MTPVSRFGIISVSLAIEKFCRAVGATPKVSTLRMISLDTSSGTAKPPVLLTPSTIVRLSTPWSAHHRRALSSPANLARSHWPKRYAVSCERNALSLRPSRTGSMRFSTARTSGAGEQRSATLRRFLADSTTLTSKSIEAASF